MKILISYFYQLRFFKPYMIPLSTAAFDPKWFHQNKGHQYKFKDKNNVYNGLRATPFVPVMEANGECSGKENCNSSPDNCGFLRNYYNQLKKLDFNYIMERFETLGKLVKEEVKFEEEPIIVLLVYETPDNSCSERVIIKRWFEENNCLIEEFDKNKEY